MNFEKRCFSSTNDQLTFDFILSMYPDRDAFRVNQNVFTPGDWCTGVSRAGLCYIIEGVCKFTFEDDQAITVKAGDVFQFPSSNYKIESDQTLGVKYSMVWNIQELVEKYGKST